MCFNIIDNKIKIAEEDITCYKLVILYGHDMDIKLGQKWYAPTDKEYRSSAVKLYPFYRYNDFFYELGKIHKISTKEVSIFHRKKPGTLTRKDYVKGGAFHSYKFMYSNHRSEINMFQVEKFKVRVKCTIPKGSLYLENNTEYISNKIRIDYISVENNDWMYSPYGLKPYGLKKFKTLCQLESSKLQLI